MDEALCTTNGTLLDDDLTVLMQGIAASAAQLFWFCDACYSGGFVDQGSGSSLPENVVLIASSLETQKSEASLLLRQSRAATGSSPSLTPGAPPHASRTRSGSRRTKKRARWRCSTKARARAGSKRPSMGAGCLLAPRTNSCSTLSRPSGRRTSARACKTRSLSPARQRASSPSGCEAQQYPQLLLKYTIGGAQSGLGELAGREDGQCVRLHGSRIRNVKFVCEYRLRCMT
mmetsp:Transcript_8410/g.25364  ORF Transcript_8410/g.25364 Transcript_8410/m.25364 type:complete len:231 (+) Transcript_8410:413-1105(+)